MVTKAQIEQFYEDVAGLGLKFPVAAIAERTGEAKGNVSRYLSRKLEPSESFLAKFYKSFKIVSREKQRKPPDQQNPDRYLELLEENDRFFKKIIHTNLAKADFVQETILAHLKAMVQEDADRKAAGDQKKREKIIQAWGKRIASNLGLPDQTDILAGMGK